MHHSSNCAVSLETVRSSPVSRALAHINFSRPYLAIVSRRSAILPFMNTSFVESSVSKSRVVDSKGSWLLIASSSEDGVARAHETR